jgi:hypothetical protein
LCLFIVYAAEEAIDAHGAHADLGIQIFDAVSPACVYRAGARRVFDLLREVREHGPDSMA